MRTLQIGAVFLISGLTFAQNAADDPGGWTKAKWGMTEAGIKAAFPQATEIEDHGTKHLGLPGYVIGVVPRKYEVLFGIDKANGLVSVQVIDLKKLVGKDGTEVDMVECDDNNHCLSGATHDAALLAMYRARTKADLNEQTVRSAKDDLLAALTNKYGNASNHTVKSTMEEFEWLFPTTVITLMWNHNNQFKQLDSVLLLYGFRKRSSDL